MKLRHWWTTGCMALFMVLAVILAEAGFAPASENLGRVLRQRYRVLRIEVQNIAVAGVVANEGTRLHLQAGELPAKIFRVAQLNTKSPRFHVRDYASVEIVSGRAATIEPGELKLPQ